MLVKCLRCEIIFKVRPAIVKIGKGKYCSKACFYATTKGRVPPWLFKDVPKIHLNCKICNKKFELWPSQMKKERGKYCSTACYHISLLGKKPHNFKGMAYHDMGYVYIYAPSHKYKTSRNYVRRSRLVVEKHIGRYLSPSEVVHHKNHIKTDDRIENLEIMTNSEHIKKHNANKRRDNFGRFIKAQ